MSKRLSLWVIISFVIITNVTGCNVSNKEYQKTSNSKTATQETTKNEGQKLDFKIKSYKSDKMKKMGYDVKFQGKRFPVPTTLNELGEDWSFDSGDTNKRESGAYDGQRYWKVGNFGTSEWYEAGTTKKFYETGGILCYKKVPVLSVGISGFRKDGQYSRNTKITGISTSEWDREKGRLGFTVKGIQLGDLLNPSIKKKVGNGYWEKNKYNIAFYRREEDVCINFVCSLQSLKIRDNQKSYIINNININVKPYKKKSKTPMGPEYK